MMKIIFKIEPLDIVNFVILTTIVELLYFYKEYVKKTYYLILLKWYTIFIKVYNISNILVLKYNIVNTMATKQYPACSANFTQHHLNSI